MNLFVNTETKQYWNRTKKNTKCWPDTKEGNASTNRKRIFWSKIKSAFTTQIATNILLKNKIVIYIMRNSLHTKQVICLELQDKKCALVFST